VKIKNWQIEGFQNRQFRRIAIGRFGHFGEVADGQSAQTAIFENRQKLLLRFRALRIFGKRAVTDFLESSAESLSTRSL
jgi:hypothetical protein